MKVMAVTVKKLSEMHLSLDDLIWNMGAIQFGWLRRTQRYQSGWVMVRLELTSETRVAPSCDAAARALCRTEPRHVKGDPCDPGKGCYHVCTLSQIQALLCLEVESKAYQHLRF